MSTALAMVRAVHFAATLILEGAVTFRFFVLESAFTDPAIPGARIDTFIRRSFIVVWAVVIISGAAWLFLLAGDIAGAPPLDALRGGVDWTVWTQTQFGAAWQLRLVAALLLALAFAIADRTKTAVPWGGPLAMLLALILTGSLAWSGHGAATPGTLGDVHLCADILHVVAAGLWIGGLLPFAVLLWQVRNDAENREAARTATRRFASIALFSVLALLVSGIVNTWFLVDGVAALFHTHYGQLLLIKIGLFLLMLAFATENRLQLTPHIGDRGAAGHGVIDRLAIHSACEFALGLAILTIVGILGRLPPSGH